VVGSSNTISVTTRGRCKSQTEAVRKPAVDHGAPCPTPAAGCPEASIVGSMPASIDALISHHTALTNTHHLLLPQPF